MKSSGRMRITEISFVAIDTQEIFNLNQKLLGKVETITSHDDVLLMKTFLSRVWNKLTLCVNPISPELWFGQIQSYWPDKV